MENDFRTALISDTTIAGLIADRVYPAAYPQKSTASAIRLRPRASLEPLAARQSLQTIHSRHEPHTARPVPLIRPTSLAS